MLTLVTCHSKSAVKKLRICSQELRRRQAAALLALTLAHDTLPLSQRLRQQVVPANERRTPNIFHPTSKETGPLHYLCAGANRFRTIVSVTAERKEIKKQIKNYCQNSVFDQIN